MGDCVSAVSWHVRCVVLTPNAYITSATNQIHRLSPSRVESGDLLVPTGPFFGTAAHLAARDGDLRSRRAQNAQAKIILFTL